MRFEVNVDDGANLDALHQARAAYNAKNAGSPAPDMPSYVQALMDQAVAEALAGLGQPTTLSAALSKIAELTAANQTLSTEVAALSSASPVTPAPAA